MSNTTARWKRGRGKLGILAPLIGAWEAQATGPMGKIHCSRSFTRILGGAYVQLTAHWELEKGTYDELALFGVDNDGKLAFWSFTSDGKHSRGTTTDASDIHPQAVGFEAKMPAGLARMVYWPNDMGGVSWAVDAKTKKGWKRFTEHHYMPA